MLLTRIWAAVLSLLATAFLAGMFLLSIGSSGGFTASDRTAVRAVTEAGLAAFEADIASSPVALGPALLKDTRLKEAMERAPDEEAEGLDLQGTLITVANEGLLETYPLMSVALIEKTGTITARTGLDESLFDQITQLGAFTTVQAGDDESLFSATLNGRLYAVKVSRPELGGAERRLVAINPVDLGGASFLRRVLGSNNPAGLVRDGQVLGEPIGGASASELVALVSENLSSMPPEGASQVLEVGEGPSKRLGAIGRVPGPAGKGEHGTVFAVLSLNTEGATQKELAQSLSDAVDKGLGQVSWVPIVGLLLVSLVLSFYLPHLESTTPLRRLAAEFRGLAQGTQHQIFHDTYGGQLGIVARAAVQAQEALRVQWEAEVVGGGDEGEEGEDGGTGPRRTRGVRPTRSSRRVGRTRRQEAVSADDGGAPAAIELPDAPEDAVLEAHSHASAAALPPPSPPDFDEAPTLTDEVEDAQMASLLGDDLGPPSREPPGPLPSRSPPPPARPRGATPGAPPGVSPRAPGPASRSTAPARPDEDPREAYYREIFNEFVETKTACGEPTAGFTFDKFVVKLRKNTADLLARPGNKDVKFSVYVKDGKAALKAKVVKE